MGKKGKKDAFLDLPDPDEEVAAEPVVDGEGDSAQPASTAKQPKKAKKDKKGKKGKFDFDSDDEAKVLPPAAAESEEDEEAPSGPAPPKAKSKKGKAKSAFALLDEEEEEESAGTGFAALNGDDDEEEEDEEEEVAAKSKAGKKPKAKSAFELLEEEGGEEQEDEEEDEEQQLSPKSSSKKEGKGKKDMSSLFAALEAGEEEQEEPAAVKEEGEEAPAAKKEKNGGKKKKLDSLFDALANEEEAAAEEAPAAESGEKAEKKKPKKKKDLDSLFAAMEEGEQPAAGGKEPSSSSSSKDKKKKKKKDLSGLLDSVGEDGDQPSASAGAAAAAPSPSGAKEGKKKAKGGEEDAELEALLAQLDAPAPAAEPGGAKKKKKKKGKGGDVGGDDDIDALLAQIDGPAAAAAKPEAAAAPEPEAAAASTSAPAATEGGEGDEGDEEGEAGGKELTAAQKKKLKKKQKEKEKKAAGGGTAEEAAAEEEEAAAAAAGVKKGKPVKESAAVRRIREELERRQKAEEEARVAEEARLKAEAEEAARLEEEERRKAEEKERKKAAAKAKKEELKRQGKLLTGKAKAEAERLAAIRAQLLAAAAEKGLELPDSSTADAEAAAAAEAAAEAERPKKRVVYNVKKTGRKKSEKAEDINDAVAGALAQEEQDKQAPAAAAAAVSPKEAAPAAAGAKPSKEEEKEEEADDWEAAADNWEDLDKSEEEEAEEPAAAAKEAPAAAKEGGKAAAGKQAPKEEEEEEKEEEGEEEEDEDEDSSEEGSSEEESSEEESSDEDDSSSYEEDSDEERERRIDEAREKRLARMEAKRAEADKEVLRSPICCILGHVDVGKTKILDNIRRTNVQDGEAGGITQQIGATFIPADAIDKRTSMLRGQRAFDMRLPGLLVIDTPGHESFTNLRQRGSGLCDIAVLIVDLMHGLEPQTIESIGMLKMRKTPFIIAINKVDRLYQWKANPDLPIRDSFKRQKEHVMKEFEDRSSQVFLQLNEQGLNVALYWKNPDPRKYVNVVPTSAISGEGIPDLLQLMVKLTQTMMAERLMLVDTPQATVLEVKTMEGLGTTVDAVLVNGTLREGDRIVVCGLGGAIVTRIKALKTPQVLKEMRVKGALMDHKEIKAAMGVKIVAPGLESAVAGTSMYVVGPDDDEEELKDAVMEDMADIFSKVDKSGEGVCVQASTLGSLEALLSFLDSPDVDIPVSGINIGPVHKRDVLRANVMNEKHCKKFGVILAFDVPVAREARELAEEYGVKIFTADIIYHLFDQFTAYMKTIKAQEQEAARLEAVFPCTLQILPTCVFNKKDPIVVGVDVVEGIAKVGTPLCVPTKDSIELGRIASMELNHKSVDKATAGQSVAMKIEGCNAEQQSRLYGRHFDHTDQLVSLITRESINALKSHFADEMGKDDWRLVIKLKKVFAIN